MKVKVVDNYTICYPSPLVLKKGETVEVLREETKPEWKGYFYCKDKRGIEGWISNSYLIIKEKKAELSKNYNATEINASKGENVLFLYEDNGWVWCRNKEGNEGWLPKEILELENSYADKTIDLFSEYLIKAASKESIFLIAIDGLGGSGKSTFSHRLKKILKKDVQVLHFDDFYKPVIERVSFSKDAPATAPNFDWERFEKDILKRAKSNKALSYQAYDWENDYLGPLREIIKSKILIIEGVSSLRKELRHYYDFKIWIDCPLETRLKRGLERDGIEMKDTWEKEWIPSENKYYDLHAPNECADLVLNQSSKLLVLKKIGPKALWKCLSYPI